MGQKGHVTGIAGEFHVMEQLFRREHEAALTLGNAKAIDIFTTSPSGKMYQVSVKSIRSGGKWVIGTHDYNQFPNLVFVLLHYKKFNDLDTPPEVWVIPAKDAEKIKLKWEGDNYALYIYQVHKHLLDPYKNAWHYLD